MTIQTPAEAAKALEEIWYPARDAAADGKSFTFATENGTRSVSSENLAEIEATITRLERRASCPSGQSHNFAVADFS